MSRSCFLWWVQFAASTTAWAVNSLPELICPFADCFLHNNEDTCCNSFLWLPGDHLIGARSLVHVRGGCERVANESGMRGTIARLINWQLTNNGHMSQPPFTVAQVDTNNERQWTQLTTSIVNGSLGSWEHIKKCCQQLISVNVCSIRHPESLSNGRRVQQVK